MRERSVRKSKPRARVVLGHEDVSPSAPSLRAFGLPFGMIQRTVSVILTHACIIMPKHITLSFAACCTVAMLSPLIPRSSCSRQDLPALCCLKSADVT